MPSYHSRGRGRGRPIPRRPVERRLDPELAAEEFASRQREAEAKKRVSLIDRAIRAAEADLALMIGEGVDTDEHLYRGPGSSSRDLPSYTHRRQMQIAYGLYLTNPLGRRIPEITKDYVVGDGFTFRVDDPTEADTKEPESEEVMKVLRAHWEDPDNNWDLKQDTRALAMYILGEALYPVFTGSVSGLVKIGYIDPLRIDKVNLDDQNAERVLSIELARNLTDPEGRILRVVGESTEADTAGYLVGDCFYYAINKIPPGRRGHSDLMHLADWIDSYDAMLFDALDAARLRSAFCWDVTMEGAIQEEIDDRISKSVPPKPGATNYHNEREKWAAVAPELGASQHDTFSRIYRTLILGGAGLPEHWFGEGDSATRATAAEMGAPVLRRLKARQKYFKYVIEQILKFQVDQAILAGVFGGRGTPLTKKRVHVDAPDFETKDIGAAGVAMGQVASSLSLAEQQQWISKGTARKIFAMAASKYLGTAVDAEAEAQAIETEASEKAGADQLAAQNQALSGLLARQASPPVQDEAAIDDAGRSLQRVGEAWDESLHPRDPESGRFLSKGFIPDNPVLRAGLAKLKGITSVDEASKLLNLAEGKKVKSWLALQKYQFDGWEGVKTEAEIAHLHVAAVDIGDKKFIAAVKDHAKKAGVKLPQTATKPSGLSYTQPGGEGEASASSEPVSVDSAATQKAETSSEKIASSPEASSKPSKLTGFTLDNEPGAVDVPVGSQPHSTLPLHHQQAQLSRLSHKRAQFAKVPPAGFSSDAGRLTTGKWTNTGSHTVQHLGAAVLMEGESPENWVLPKVDKSHKIGFLGVYASTQQALSSKGVESVPAYRGVVVSRGLADTWVSTGRVAPYPVESWTEDAGVAKDFSVPSAGWEPDQAGVIFRSRVPREEIWATHETPFQTGYSKSRGSPHDEKEVTRWRTGLYKVLRVQKTPHHYIIDVE